MRTPYVQNKKIRGLLWAVVIIGILYLAYTAIIETVYAYNYWVMTEKMIDPAFESMKDVLENVYKMDREMFTAEPIQTE